MSLEAGRAGVGAGDEGSASPTESFATDNPPPSPCLDNDLNEDDATPRQQWSPVHTVGGRGGAHPDKQLTRGYNGGSVGGGTFAGAGGGSERRAHPGRGSRAGGGGGAEGQAPRGGGSAATSALFQKPRHLPAQPDSPVLRVDDLERLDLSVLALGEDGGPTVPPHGVRGRGHPDGVSRRSDITLNPGTFRSEPGPITQEGRPRSLGGRPSRHHTLFVKPGQLGTGPASPPSSYSTHSESGFASPTTRLASPLGYGATAAPRAREQQQQHQLHPVPSVGRVKKGKWKCGKEIGAGSCAKVYLGMNEDTGELMAVKEITLASKERELTSLYNEIQVLHKLVHPHIVGYLGAELQDSERRLCIFQEWVPAGSLHSLLEQFGALSDAMTRKYTRQVLEGLAYLHANRVVHRDVKSKNILVDDRGNVKLADFGAALVLQDDMGDGVQMTMAGTPVYMAPEMMLKRKCGKRVDVWSLGCVTLEMVTSRRPWADIHSPSELSERFDKTPGPPPMPDDLSPSLRDFLLACFTWEAGKRPTSRELLVGYQYLRSPGHDGQGGSGSGSPNGGGGKDNDIPLEAMGRVPFMSRMRRCSSATLPELLQRSQPLGGVEAFAPFAAAPSGGSLRPPSPRYAPGGAAHGRRTPTRRRVNTETAVPMGMPLLETSTSGSKDLVRRSSMPATRSPPISPDKPRRPGRGCSPGRSWNSLTAAGQQQQQQQYHHHLQQQQHADEDGRVGSGPVMHARLRSLGDGIDFHGLGCSGSGGSSSSRLANGGASRGVSSSAGTGRTDSEASMSRSSSDAPVSAAGGAGAGAGARESLRKAAPTPIFAPVVREVLETLDQGGESGAPGAAATGHTPPPTVRPLELRRSVSANAGWGVRGARPPPAETEQELQPPTGMVGMLPPLRQKEAAVGGGGGGGGGKVEGTWAVGGGMSDVREGGSCRIATEEGE